MQITTPIYTHSPDLDKVSLFIGSICMVLELTSKQMYACYVGGGGGVARRGMREGGREGERECVCG